METHEERNACIEGTRQKVMASEDNVGSTIRKAVDLLQMQMNRMDSSELLNIILPLEKESLDIAVDNQRDSPLCSLGYLLSEHLETAINFISKKEEIRQRISRIKQEATNRDNGEFNDLCALSEVRDGIQDVENEQAVMTKFSKGNQKKDEDARCPFKCDVCGKKFTQKVAVTAHKKRIHLRDDDPLKHRFKCDGCGKKFFDISRFEQHKRIHYENEEEKKPFKCEKCDFRTTYKTSIKLHMRVHLATDDLSLEKFQCDICEKYYNSRDGLRKHKKLHLDNVELSRPHKCDECGKRFSQKGSFRKHVKNHHSSDPRQEFECEVCGKLYKTKQSLFSHKVVHLGESLKCEKCDETFTCKVRLSAHMRRHNKPFECVQCGMKFIFDRNLQAHIARIHELTSRSTTANNGNSEREDEEMDDISESDEGVNSSDDINSDEE